MAETRRQPPPCGRDARAPRHERRCERGAVLMARRRPWLFVVVGALGVGGVVGLSVGAYWRYANVLPAYALPRVALPVPNAYTDYCQAGAMCQAVGGARVLASSAGPPSASGGTPRPL